MGNNIVRCLFPRLIEPERNQFDTYITNPPDLLFNNNPIATAIHMISAPSEEEALGMALILSNNVAAVANSDQTENGLKFLLEYLQLSLPMDCPVSGSITTLIIKEATLPSRSFLREVATILKLDSLTIQLDEFAKDSSFMDNNSVLNPSNVGIDHISEEINPILNSTSNNRSSRKVSLFTAFSRSLFNENKNSSMTLGNTSTQVKVNETSSKQTEINQILLKTHNACLIIDCLATRLCGPNATYLLNDTIIRFLVMCCNLSQVKKDDVNNSQIWCIVLRAILCLEKFALTKSCMDIVYDYLKKETLTIPFIHLEYLCESENMLKREVGFCAQWLLDNTYIIPDRVLTHNRIDRSNLNAIMNIRDASQYIKLSPNGLEVRCDSDSFESVRCTFEVKKGIYYYEAQLVTAGIMQIGWATKRSQYMTHDGLGIGDDMYSCAYDGCRKMIWYSGIPHQERLLPNWKPGDILGCLINLNHKFLLFSLNGKYTKKQHMIFNKASTGFYAGASFLNNQQCLFNFGRTPFKYPPSILKSSTHVSSCSYRSFNEAGELSDSEKIVYPRLIQLSQMIKSTDDIKDPCTICYLDSANVFLEPCNHRGFCEKCMSKVECCPLCRSTIKSIKRIKTEKIVDCIGEK